LVQAGDDTRTAHLRVDLRREPDRVVLSLHGELDLASAPLLQTQLDIAEAGEAKLIVLDVQSLEFTDSTGLRTILAAHERAREHGHELALTRVQQQLQRLLAITHVGEHLRIIGSPDELLV
jgi:anti-sigma B factor antagonist